MELHQGTPRDRDRYEVNWSLSIEHLFERAKLYAEEHHKDTLSRYRFIKPDGIRSQDFWSEYIWTCYTSGFSAKVLSTFWHELLDAYGPWTLTHEIGIIWPRVSPIIANRRKCESILTTRGLMQELGWETFWNTYCKSVDTLQQLPFVGKITKNHLGRNLGLDCVKEDIHLTRLADHYEFPNATLMCEFLAGLYDERIGVVDFILWAYAAAFGTAHLIG